MFIEKLYRWDNQRAQNTLQINQDNDSNNKTFNNSSLGHKLKYTQQNFKSKKARSSLELYRVTDKPWSSLVEADESRIGPSGKLLSLWQTQKNIHHMQPV